jgi:hypothetical protein
MKPTKIEKRSYVQGDNIILASYGTFLNRREHQKTG